MGCESSIVIDDNDHVYIAYQDRSQSKLDTRNQSGSWDIYAVDSTNPSDLYPGYDTSMVMGKALEADDIAHFDDKKA